MNTTSILIALTAFAIGTVIALILSKNRKSSGATMAPPHEESEKADLCAELDKIKKEASQELTQTKERYENLLAEAKERHDSSLAEAKEKHDSLLAKAKEECKHLDDQLKAVTEGQLDEYTQTLIKESNKLKSKIKELEEELEDKDDDLDSIEKKYKRTESEYENAKDEIDRYKKEQKNKEQELETLRTERDEINDRLTEISEDNKIKQNSLKFIQAVLKAPTQDSNSDQTAKQINLMEPLIKDQYLDLNSFLFRDPTIKRNYQIDWKDISEEEGLQAKKKYLLNGFDEWAAKKRKSWLNGKTAIAFVGEFSAGKTSIVNRILSQDNPKTPKLPVSAKATTAIPTYISGGLNQRFDFLSGDSTLKTLDKEIFMQVSKEVLDEVPGVSSLIKYFIMSYENPNLDGLSILDTPGFNSNDAEDRARTIDVINECDALFWVFDVNSGTINRSSLSTIKEKLNKPLYIVINKVDTKSRSEVDEVEKLITNTMKEEGLSPQKIIRFSAKADLDELMEVIKSVNKNNVRDQYIESLEEDLKKIEKEISARVEFRKIDITNLREKREKLTEEINSTYKQIERSSDAAATIPQWTEHIFSSNRYEMDQHNGDLLKQILTHIKNVHTPMLKKQIEELNSVEKEIQTITDTKRIFEFAQYKVEIYKEQFENTLKSIK